MLRAVVDTVLSALRTLGANKLRSALTLLGIVIGVVAVVSMAATTVGLRRKITEDLEFLGGGVFQVQKQPQGGFGGGRNWLKYQKRKNFTLGDVELLRQQCDACLRVGGEVWDSTRRISAGEHELNSGAQIVGGTSEFFDNNGFALASGRLYDEAEAAHGAHVIVLGPDLVDVLFPGESPLGKTVHVRDQSFRVIGTLVRRGDTFTGSIDSIASIPISTFLLEFGGLRSINVTIQAKDPDHMGRAEDQVVALLRKYRNVAPEDENDFELFSNRSMQDTFEQMTGSIAVASVGICAIALLIGGIGVMNIMLVAVTERTSEIGLRRALGARRRRILAQFVFEAVVLTSIGGALGIGLGAGCAYLVKVMVGLPTVVPLWAVALSMLSAGGTGLVFGIYPAYRASQLDPVEAMRHE
jgi:putative ABC transport system permease protein